MMRIWILTQFFPPEIGAGAIRLGRLARMLAADGHRVTVLTGMPNYPQGVIHRAYRGRLTCNEIEEGVEIRRVWVYASPSKRARSRLATQFSLTVTAALRGTFLPRPDVILVESHPLPICLAGMWLKRIKRAPVVLNVSDLWPESAVATGALKADSPIVKVAERVERWAYRDAAHIAGMTQGVVDGILKQHPQPERVTLVPNAIDLTAFHPASIDERRTARARLGLDDRFVVAHVGNMSLTYDFDTIVDTAARLPEIVFLFVGDGSQAGKVSEQIAARKLTNAQMLGVLPHDQMPTIWQAADASVIALGDHSLAEGTRPAKMYEALATGTPIVAAIRGEGAALLEASGGGIVTPPGDRCAFARALQGLAEQPERRSAMQRAGRAYAEKHLAPERVKSAFVEIFQRVIRK